MLASGTWVHGFKPSRSLWIFRASEKSSACLPSEGNLSHVPDLLHVKEPSTSVNYECGSKIPCIVPSFASRGLACLCGVWRLWRWMRARGKGAIGLQAAVPKGPTRDFFFTDHIGSSIIAHQRCSVSVLFWFPCEQISRLSIKLKNLK